MSNNINNNRTKRVVIINASLHGELDNSNTVMLLRYAEKQFLKLGVEVVFISPEQIKFKSQDSNLEQSIHVLPTNKIMTALEQADGIVVGTGTYWGQSSSVLQKFIEDVTMSEGSSAWLGKPMGLIVGEHSTGGQTVLCNLMLTFSNYGCIIPPQSSIVFSRTGQEAIKNGGEWIMDVWHLEDIDSICEKVVAFMPIKESTTLTARESDKNPESFHARWVNTNDIQ
jgi:multimeric flavodoxin WrbA